MQKIAKIFVFLQDWLGRKMLIIESIKVKTFVRLHDLNYFSVKAFLKMSLSLITDLILSLQC